MRRWAAVAAACILGAAGAAAFEPRSTTTCDAANPFDNLPDDVALQACLDNYDAVLLRPNTGSGYVGYLIANTLRLKRTNGLLTSAAIPAKATVLAAPGLNSSILRVSSVDGFEISFIRFDGNRENRQVRDKACTDVRDYRNIELTGNGFSVRYVESAGAVCGSAMTVGNSSNFQIVNSLFYDNGRQPEDANGIAGLWSDGLTVFKCENSTIRDNDFWDNTDVDLGVNGGSRCAVYRNSITHGYQYAFAGLVIGDPTRSGGEFSSNIVSSGYNLLGFGIIVGCHPWTQCGGGYASDVVVHDNVSTGSVVNFAVDGLNGGSIHDNSMRGAQGTRLPDCSGPAADYTVGHAINVGPLQTGYVMRIFDAGLPCQPL
jgi:parallel beta helix pectate lyase-like protein